MLHRIKVLELIDAIEHISYQLLKEYARCNPNLATKITSYSDSKGLDVAI